MGGGTRDFRPRNAYCLPEAGHYPLYEQSQSSVPVGKKFDDGKTPLHMLLQTLLIPVWEEVARVLKDGADKHDEPPGQMNWQFVEDAANRYMAADLRHVFAYRKGEMKSPEGFHHLAHAICDLAFIMALDIKEGRYGK